MIAQKDLWEAIDRTIQEMIKPPVLTSSRWLRHFPKGKPADFQFTGTVKMAKATGKNVHRVAGKLLKQLPLESLGLTGEVTAEGFINIRERAGRPKGASAGKGKSGRGAGKGTKDR